MFQTSRWSKRDFARGGTRWARLSLRHLETQSWFAGKTADGKREAVARARAKLEELMAPLGEVTLGDVAVRLFEVEVNGEQFALADYSDPVEQLENVVLIPNGLWFSEPWDGRHDGG